jgi:predicted GNAT family acetyltransferase
MTKEDLLDEGLEETFPASDPVSAQPEPSVRDNEELHRFEAEVDGHLAHLRYMRKDGLLHLVHTEVPEAMRSRGVGAALARFALETARHEGIKVKVVCPYVKRFLANHPEYASLVAE